MNCWHCSGSSKCACLLCGKDVPGNGAELVIRVAGACVVCKGAVEVEKYRQLLTRFDPRDRNLWSVAHDGVHYHRVFLPLDYVKLLETTGEWKYIAEENRWVA